jgi:putative OPT family oligopeptide transporter
MAGENQPSSEGPKFQPYVPSNVKMAEFTVRAFVLGLIMCVVLGAANAYLGLKAGMTIAATYPAAVISMAVLRLFKGSILEENMARTVGSIGESVAAGAIFTLPAFLIAGAWKELNYFQSVAIMMVGGVIGVLFVTLLRRVMVEDRDLPYPESVAAGAIHKAGRSGGTGAMYLFLAGILGSLIEAAKRFSLFAEEWKKFVPFSGSSVKLGGGATAKGGGGALLSSPGVSPAYFGVGYIIGPKLASLNFSGGLLAWGLFVPLLLYFLGPQIEASALPGVQIEWADQAKQVWKNVVRPVAIGGMLLSAGFTLWRMRKSLGGGLRRSIGDVKKAAAGGVEVERTERDIRFRWVLGGLAFCGVLTFFLYYYFTKTAGASAVATGVMIVAGFFFAAVSGYLVGLIGSSNNPISGLTLSTVIIAALLMVALGQTGPEGVIAVLGVAGVICVSAAVAGEMLQDLKVGHILGGTPWKMQVGNIVGVLVASSVMYFPIFILDQTQHLGSDKLPAPQASLMALVSNGIVGGTMQWPLIIVGMCLAGALILVQVRSPMLVCVGMYLPLDTTFAIFLGGLVKGILDMLAERRKLNPAQKTRVENIGILIAAGLIAGEALFSLVFEGIKFGLMKYRGVDTIDVWKIFENPSFLTSLIVFVVIGLALTVIPLRNAGRPDEPAPPSAMM